MPGENNSEINQSSVLSEQTSPIPVSSENKSDHLFPEKENPYFPRDKINSTVIELVGALSPETPPSSLNEKVRQVLLSGGIVDGNDPRMKQLDDSISSIENSDKTTLTDSLTEALDNFLTKTVTPKEYEARLREKFVREGGFTKLNELISYHRGESGENVFIHLAPARTMGEKEGMHLFTEGLSALAVTLDTLPELRSVKTVEALSWIITEKPQVMERLGFTLDGPVDTQTMNAHFSGETNVSRAHMERPDFIARYKPKI